MTLSELEAILKLATEKTYEIEAPAGETRYIVWHAYNTQAIYGDDRRVCEADRVQLDVYWQRNPDTLLGDLKRILGYFRIAYDVEDLTWDDERQLRRAILQLTVV